MEIVCNFKDVREWGDLYPDETKTKKGRYHGSSFPIPGFGINQWVVCGYLEIPEYQDSPKIRVALLRKAASKPTLPVIVETI